MSKKKHKDKTLVQRYYEVTDFQLRCGEDEDKILAIGEQLKRKLDAAEALRGDLARTLQAISVLTDPKCIEIASRLNTIVTDFDKEFYHKD